MTVGLGLFFHDSHATLCAFVCPLALLLLVLYNFNTLNRLLTVDTRDHDIRTDSLMLIDLFPNTLSLTPRECFTFDRLVLAVCWVRLNLSVAQYLLTAKLRVLTDELHVL
jgi:hypothetical protein